MNCSPTTFGSKLFELRTRRAISQQKLAAIAGLSKAYVSSIENERKAPPSPRAVRKLSAALALSPAQLRQLERLAECNRMNCTVRVSAQARPDVAALIKLIARQQAMLSPTNIAHMRQQLEANM